ncbi:hypothetical protein C2G38_2100626, partial [Gigaspora rosea]
MVEMTTGRRCFNDYKFYLDLIFMICKGLRPKFKPGIPEYYVELANQCMNSEPEKRPKIIEIIAKLDEWLKIIKNENENKNENESENSDENSSESRIKKQFLESDEISKSLPTITEKLNNAYTSKRYHISEIGSKSPDLHIFSKTAKVPDD